MRNNYTDFLQEVTYFISGGNKYYNIKKFKFEDNGKLFIVGLSGSGKSVFGKNISKKYNCEYINLDEMDRNHRKKISTELNKDMWDKDINRLVHAKMTTFFRKIMNVKGKLVIEGIHILYHDHSFFKDKAVIIMGTSVLLSSLRAYQRNFLKYHHRASRLQLINDIYLNQKEFIIRLKQFEQVMDGKI